MTNPKRPEADTRMREIRESCDYNLARYIPFANPTWHEVKLLLTRVEELEARCLKLDNMLSPAGKEEFLLLEQRDNLASKLQDAEQALGLIAAPMRNDGTYNRSREACEQLASECLQRIRSTERVCDYPALVGTEKKGYVCVRCNQNETERGERG